jgi:phosphatidylserine synthase
MVQSPENWDSLLRYHQQNPKKYNITLGGVLDDVSDTVSFCIAPAVIFYMLMGRVADESIQSLPYGWIAILYVVLGISRLVFFILDQNSIPGFFKGIPVPGAALLVAAPFIMIGNALESNTTDLVYWSKFSFFLMIIAAILMISFPIRYMHIGRLMSRSRKFLIFTIVLVIGFVFTPYFGHAALGYLILYVFSPLYTWRISPDIASQEHLEKLSTS